MLRYQVVSQRQFVQELVAVIIYVMDTLHILSCPLLNLICMKQKPGVPGTCEFQDGKSLHRNFLLGQECRGRQLDLVHISFGSVPVKVPFGGKAVRLRNFRIVSA